MTAPSVSTLGVKNYTYDPFGRVATETDGNGHTTTFTYDNDDRVLTEAFSDGTHTVSDNYDDNGNQINSTSATGTITNTYDPDNRLLSTANSAGGGTVSYGYDLAGNETSTTDGKGTVSYSYDPANVLWAMTYPHGSGTETDRYKIDSRGDRTDTYVNAGANSASSTTALTTAPTTWTGHTSATYDPANGKVTNVKAYTGKDATKVFDTTYSYVSTTLHSETDQIQTATDNLTGKVTTYGYNTDGRLTSADQTGGSSDWNWAYTYDKDGNRLTADQSGAYTSHWNLAYNTANQITSSVRTWSSDAPAYVYEVVTPPTVEEVICSAPSYAYVDPAGNLTAAAGSTYAYDGAEQMTSSTVGGVTTSYTYAGASEDQVLTEDSSNGDFTFTYGKQSPEGVPEIDTLADSQDGSARVLSDPVSGTAVDLSASDGTTGSYVVDGENNMVAVVTDAGTEPYTATNDPYGTGGNSSISDYQFYDDNPYGFVAGTTTTDAAPQSLTKFGARWYLANQGSWTQMDTLDAPLDPANADRYAYAGDDPINATDPDGEDPLGCINAVAGSIVAIAGIVLLSPTGLGETIAAGVLIGGGAVVAATSIYAECDPNYSA